MSGQTGEELSGLGGPSRRALVVIGMHRSGTSAMTRMLSLLGAKLPKQLMLPHEDNPSGFWEPQSVADLNDEILNALDSDWDDVFAFRPRAYLSNFDRYYAGRAVELLNEEFGEAELIVLKDPRISVLSSFWDRALNDAGYTTHYVLMVRNPLEVAESLRTRDGFPREKSLLLWSSYMIAAERDTRDRQRTFVAYDQLLKDWRSVRSALSASMNMPFPRETSAAAVEIDRYLDRTLRHHDAAPEDIFSRDDVSQDIKTLARIFFDAAAGAEIDTREIEAVQQRLAELDMLVGPLLADLRGQARSLAKDVATLNDAHAGARQQADAFAEELATEKAARQAEADARNLQSAELVQQIEAMSEERDRLAAELNESLSRVEALGTQLASLEVERERLAAEADQTIGQVDALGTQVASAEAERDRLAAEMRGKDAEIESLRRQAEELRVETLGARANLADLQQRIDGIDSEVEEAIRSVELRVERKIEEAVSARDRVAAELDEERERLQARQAEIETLLVEKRHLQAVSAAADAKLVRFERRLEEVEAEFELSMRTVEERAGAERERLIAALDEANATLARFRNSVSWRLTKPVRWTGRAWRRLGVARSKGDAGA